MAISRRGAVIVGSTAIAVVLGLICYLLADIKCYRPSLSGVLVSLVVFFGPGIFAALRALLSENPLRSIGASAGLGGWIGYAYYSDCMSYPGTGGFGVLFVLILGTPSAVLGAYLVGAFCRSNGIVIAAHPSKAARNAP